MEQLASVQTHLRLGRGQLFTLSKDYPSNLILRMSSTDLTSSSSVYIGVASPNKVGVQKNLIACAVKSRNTHAWYTPYINKKLLNGFALILRGVWTYYKWGVRTPPPWWRHCQYTSHVSDYRLWINSSESCLHIDMTLFYQLRKIRQAKEKYIPLPSILREYSILCAVLASIVYTLNIVCNFSWNCMLWEHYM